MVKTITVTITTDETNNSFSQEITINGLGDYEVVGVAKQLILEAEFRQVEEMANRDLMKSAVIGMQEESETTTEDEITG
tara:strand:- start:100 stop:336 length:237 start_codon:yes stop_codon:yes gene_type:complete